MVQLVGGVVGLAELKRKQIRTVIKESHLLNAYAAGNSHDARRLDFEMVGHRWLDAVLRGWSLPPWLLAAVQDLYIHRTVVMSWHGWRGPARALSCCRLQMPAQLV